MGVLSLQAEVEKQKVAVDGLLDMLLLPVNIVFFCAYSVPGSFLLCLGGTVFLYALRAPPNILHAPIISVRLQ